MDTCCVDAEKARVRSVLERYAVALDRRDVPGLAGCFARGAEFVISKEARLDTPDATEDVRVGPKWEDLVSLFEGTAAQFKTSTHFTGISTIEIAEAEATAETYSISFAAPNGSNELWIRGVRYLDELVLEDGEWKIRRRLLTLDWAAATPTIFVNQFADRVRQ